MFVSSLLMCKAYFRQDKHMPELGKTKKCCYYFTPHNGNTPFSRIHPFVEITFSQDAFLTLSKAVAYTLGGSRSSLDGRDFCQQVRGWCKNASYKNLISPKGGIFQNRIAPSQLFWEQSWPCHYSPGLYNKIQQNYKNKDVETSKY